MVSAGRLEMVGGGVSSCTVWSESSTAWGGGVHMLGGAATLTNAFDWVSGCGKTGVLEATCAVELAASATRTNGWTLSFGETVHALKPDGKMPPGADVPALVDAIARLAPFELFDPHGTHLDLAYADPELRIMGVGLGSKRGANNLHLLSRLDGPWGLNKAADDDDDDD